MKELARGTLLDGFEASDEPVASDPTFRGSGVRAAAGRTQPSRPPGSRTLTEAEPLVVIRAPALPSLLEPTYAYLAAYCDACLPPQLSQRLTVAIYELCSNALSYGSAAGDVRIELSRLPTGIGFSVANHAEPAHLARLTEQLTRVAEDAAATFDREMNGFARGSEPPPKLGLVRITHESALGLEPAIEGDRVRISTFCAI